MNIGIKYEQNVLVYNEGSGGSVDDTLKRMIKIYGIREYDWMNFKITRDNPLTYHHIKKEEHGGKRTIANGAPLTKLAHVYIHQIERDDQRNFVYLSKLLQKINNGKNPPTKKQLQAINEVLKNYESKNDNVLRRRILSLNFNYYALSITGVKDIYSPTNVRMVMQAGINPRSWLENSSTNDKKVKKKKKRKKK